MIKEGKELLYLSKEKVIQLGMPLRQVMDLIEVIYEEKAKGDLQNPPKAVIPIAPGCNSYAMPALLQSTDYFGMTWQSSFNPNVGKGLSTTTGVVGLYRKPTGIQIAILEDFHIESLCRGAMAGLCTKYLAKEDSATVTIIGCGHWAKSYLLGVHIALPGLKNVFIYDRQHNRRDTWLAEMQQEVPEVEFQIVDIKEGVSQADILITSDVLYQGIDEPGEIEPGMLRKGCLVISANQDQQFVKGAINQDVDKVVTDDLKQYIEKKELFVKDIATMPIDFVDFTTGKAKRLSEEETFFCCLLGVSASNTMVAYDIFQRALKQGIGSVMVL